jgi:hypothetical protein
MGDEMFEHLAQLRTIILNTRPSSDTMPEQVADFISSQIKLQMFLEFKYKCISGKEFFEQR